jgi:hypothetical protein
MHTAIWSEYDLKQILHIDKGVSLNVCTCILFTCQLRIFSLAQKLSQFKIGGVPSLLTYTHGA